MEEKDGEGRYMGSGCSSGGRKGSTTLRATQAPKTSQTKRHNASAVQINHLTRTGTDFPQNCPSRPSS